jgi:uncharacterized protein GlcG (DUF336 family)
MNDITLEMAEAVLAAARKRAQKIGVAMNIAVMDAGGNLKAFERIDGAWLGSIDIAIRKARTARYFDMDTGDLGKLSKPGAPAYMIEVSNGATEVRSRRAPPRRPGERYREGLTRLTPM